MNPFFGTEVFSGDPKELPHGSVINVSDLADGRLNGIVVSFGWAPVHPSDEPNLALWLTGHAKGGHITPDIVASPRETHSPEGALAHWDVDTAIYFGADQAGYIDFSLVPDHIVDVFVRVGVDERQPGAAHHEVGNYFVQLRDADGKELVAQHLHWQRTIVGVGYLCKFKRVAAGQPWYLKVHN